MVLGIVRRREKRVPVYVLKDFNDEKNRRHVLRMGDPESDQR